MSKKENITGTAEFLFLKHGFKKVSVEEICKNAGVSRKTFYIYFKNKEDLVLFLLKEISADGFKLYYEIINDASLSFAEKLEKTTLAKLELSKRWTLEFFTDLMQFENSELVNFYNEMVKQSFSLMYNFLKSAQEKSEIDSSLNLHYIMWVLQKQIEHMNEPELLNMFPTIEEMIKQMTQVFVNGISKLRK
ncbi:MAG: TetR/AcrR family transcriptional regulator [Paludibacteraceae bacterium]